MQKYLLGLWIFLLVACQEERLEQGLQSGFLIALSEIESEVETRTAPADLPDPVKTEFKVTIRNQETDKQQTVKWSEEVVPVEPGTYTLTAEFGENPDLGFDQPYYKGEKTDQTVRDGYTKEVSIPCEVANALVSIRIKEEDQAEFEKNFPDAYVKISVGSVKVQMWTDLNTSAYFKAGSTLSQLILYKGHETGELDLLKEAGATVPKPFQAKDHLIITLGLQGQNGNLSLVVEKAEIKEETISETIPMEWLPRPKVEAEGFEGNQLSFVETETKAASIRLVTAAALQDLKLKFNFEDEQFQSSLQKEKEYILSNAEDKQAVETALGITLPTIGTKEASLDLSPLLSKLQTNAGVATINSIEIDAKANNRWSSEEIEGQEPSNLKYTLVCNKPEFSVVVQPGNVWSKEFTVDELEVTAGNLELIKQQLKYQYKNQAAGDEDWQDITDLKVHFTEHPQNKNYQVRAVYRDVIASEVVDVVLETPTQLPNSGMEDWQVKNLGSFVGIPNFWDKYNFYDFLPYNNENNIWWTTNNERSRDYSVSRVHVTSSPCVSYSENTKYTGSRSALIYTSGHGGGYASTSGTLYPEGAFAGSLFIGTYGWNRDNGENITKGHPFSSRPTTLKFWYNYVPKNTDTFQAYVELKNGDELVGSGTFTSSTSNGGWVEAIIDIEYVDQPKNATSIYVQFLSTTKTSFSEGDFDKNKGITFPVMGDWNAHIGSMLYIDDISLVYDK